jgi:hypothetical protein
MLPSFLEFTGTHTNTSRSIPKWPIQELPPQKSWEIWKKLVCKQFLLSKLGRLGTATLENTTWTIHTNPQQTITSGTGSKPGPNTIVENTHLFNLQTSSL